VRRSRGEARVRIVGVRWSPERASGFAPAWLTAFAHVAARSRVFRGAWRYFTPRRFGPSRSAQLAFGLRASDISFALHRLRRLVTLRAFRLRERHRTIRTSRARFRRAVAMERLVCTLHRRRFPSFVGP